MGFSVLMSVYKKEKPEYLKAAMESVFSQSLLPDEVILIEDGPLTGPLDEAIAQLKAMHKEIVTFRFAENVKLGRALAKGVELSTNELIARMDTDDIVAENRFAVQYEYMQNHSEIAICGGWLQEFNDAGTYSRVKKMPRTSEQIKEYGKYRNPLNHMTVMFRRTAILSAGNYHDFPLLEDYELWNRVLSGGNKAYNLPQVLVYMRTNDGMYDRRGGITYFRQYQSLRKKQRELGLLNGAEYAKALFLTAGMTLQPAFVRKIMYRNVLRK